MTVGIMSVRLAIPGAHSLKDKRRALRSIKDRLRSQFNISVAEVAHQDVWQTACLGLAAVGVDRPFVEGLLDTAVRMMQRSREAVVAAVEKEFFQASLDL